MSEDNWQEFFGLPSDKNKVHDPEITDRCINTDCMEYMKKLPDNCVDMVVTDPPYRYRIEHGVSRTHTVRSISDLSPIQTYFDMLFQQLSRILKPDGCMYVFCDENSYPIFYYNLYPMFEKIRCLVWDKMHCKLGHNYRHQNELIIFVTGKDYRPIKTGDGDVIKQHVVSIEDRIHDAQKPIPLLQKLIAKHGGNNLVFDPFGGSGSTAIAAGLSGNHYLTTELDIAYYEKMKRNIEKHLGAAY